MSASGLDCPAISLSKLPPSPVPRTAAYSVTLSGALHMGIPQPRRDPALHTRRPLVLTGRQLMSGPDQKLVPLSL